MSAFRRRRASPPSSTNKHTPLPIPENGRTIPPITLPWTTGRDKVVAKALEQNDIDALRKISALPGGYGSEEMRRRVWPVLLHIRGVYQKAVSAAEGSTLNSSSPDFVGNEKGDGGGEPQHIGSGVAGPSTHPDEGQVLLDTKRAFVTYPKGLPAEGKLRMQADLQDLIVGVLRKYPKLSYFQGYHDILSVLYLTFMPSTLSPPSRSRSRSTSSNHTRRASGATNTLVRDGDSSGKLEVHQARISELENRPPDELPPDLALLPPPYSAIDKDTPEWRMLRMCAEVVSLCLVRDAMGKGLEPMLGLLRILKRILKVADPEVAQFSSFISPVPSLPFFALSWILCLFSHDIDTLEPIQRMFDFLLARNPISAIYLAVAILIVKKPQMFELAEQLGSEGEQDPSLLHPLFARIPPLCSDAPGSPDRPPPMRQSIDNEDDSNPYDPIPLSRLFALTDDLMARFPWDGETVRGREIMGEGSVVSSYDVEVAARSKGYWCPQDALGLIDRDVVKPGAGTSDDDEEEVVTAPIRRRPKSRLRLPRNKLGTTVAFSIFVLGIGMAIFGVRVGGPRAEWTRWWWLMVIRTWAGKGDKASVVKDGYVRVIAFLGRTIRDLL